jgi:Phosphatidylinositol-specific phospholipase C, X domain
LSIVFRKYLLCICYFEVVLIHVTHCSYPLILSIENHCSLPQQRNMANGFRDVFGDMLLTDAVAPNTNGYLPSPNQLKRKIILKVELIELQYSKLIITLY